jgi:hypothetical protein
VKLSFPSEKFAWFTLDIEREDAVLNNSSKPLK